MMQNNDCYNADCMFVIASLVTQNKLSYFSNIDKREEHLFCIKCPFVFFQYFLKRYTGK